MYLKRKIILTSLLIIGLICVIGLSYAKFVPVVPEGNNNLNTILGNTIDSSEIIPTFTVNFDEGDNILDSTEFDSEYQKLLKFKISTTYDDSQAITIKLKTVTKTSNGTYALYSCSSENYINATIANISTLCTSIGSGSLPAANTNIKIQTNSSITIEADSTNYYVLYINNIATTYNYYSILSVRSIPIPLTELIVKAHPPVSDAIASTYVTSATGINFSQISSLTNGQGLYINNKANIANDPTTGLVKYFRGGTYCVNNGVAFTSSNLCTTAGGTWTNYTCSYDLSKSACEGAGFTWYELKNNVKFADKYWKIIRIDEQGNIRLLYNGNATTATGEDTQYGTSEFNSSMNDAAYVGYMIPNFTGNTTSVLEATRNDTDSTIKGVVEDFYDEVLGSYIDKIADSSYCGDRSITSGPGFGASTTNYTYYGPYTRLLLTNKTPTYSCPSSNDLYTRTTSLVGNKKLTKSIGLVTMDEAAYAGGVYATDNYTYYMQSGGYYWTMSPFHFYPSLGTSSVWYVYTAGSAHYNYVYYGSGVRPSISLKPDVTVSSGTGTLDDPWIVEP